MRRRHWIFVGFSGSALIALVAALLLGGCDTLGYYAQGAAGHLKLITSARPVADWEADPASSAALRTRLALSQEMRDFAVKALALPDNASYRRYADLGRNAAVWNVVAAPELSLELKKSCFLIVGCVGYRGVFDEAAADRYGAELKGQGDEIWVYPVPAYSSLGWFSDPLLNTFIFWSEDELARLIFHELAHQVAYAKGDTTFNESFAVSVERLGAARWAASRGHPMTPGALAAADARRADFRALTGRYRDELQKVYTSGAPDAERRREKAAVYARLRADYEALKAGPWKGYAGYDDWFAQVNNAVLGVQAAYDSLVPAFERLFEREGSDFPRFYAEVQRLAALPKAERDAQLGPP